MDMVRVIDYHPHLRQWVPTHKYVSIHVTNGVGHFRFYTNLHTAAFVHMTFGGPVGIEHMHYDAIVQLWGEEYRVMRSRGDMKMLEKIN